MISQDVMDRTAFKRQAALQTIPMLGEYPKLRAWLLDLLDNKELYPEAAFEADSRLTTKGLPIEYAVVWPSHSVRCTVDVLPHGNAVERTRQTLQMSGSDKDGFQQEIILDLIAQDKTMLRYGAWLGIREANGKIAAKPYLEVGASHNPAFCKSLGISGHDLASLGVKPVMVGLPADKGGVEVYFRLSKMDRAFMRWLLAYFGFPDRTHEMFKMFEEVCDSHLPGSLSWSSLGFSVAWSQDKEAQSVTFYSFANSAIGSDARVRENIMRLGLINNWDMDLYEELSREAVGTTDLNTFHGMVGVVAGRQGPVHFTVGISPVNSHLL